MSQQLTVFLALAFSRRTLRRCILRTLGQPVRLALAGASQPQAFFIDDSGGSGEPAGRIFSDLPPVVRLAEYQPAVENLPAPRGNSYAPYAATPDANVAFTFYVT